MCELVPQSLSQESVQELLQTPVEREQVQSVYHGNGNHRELVDPELSMFPIPHM